MIGLPSGEHMENDGLSLWHFPSFSRIYTAATPIGALDLDGSETAFALTDEGGQTVRVLDRNSGSNIRTFKKFPATVSCISLTSDRTRVAVADGSKTVKILSVKNEGILEDRTFSEEIETFVFGHDAAPAMAMSKRGALYFSKSGMAPSKVLSTGFRGEKTVMFSRNGRWLFMWDYRGKKLELYP